MKTPATIIGLRLLKHARIAKALATTCKLLLLICAATMTQGQPATNFVTGALWRETWFSFPGYCVSDLISDWRYPSKGASKYPRPKSVANFDPTSSRR